MRNVKSNLESSINKNPTAKIDIKNTQNNEIKSSTSSGTGPVDAIYKAINKQINFLYSLIKNRNKQWI